MSAVQVLAQAIPELALEEETSSKQASKRRETKQPIFNWYKHGTHYLRRIELSILPVGGGNRRERDPANGLCFQGVLQRDCSAIFPSTVAN